MRTIHKRLLEIPGFLGEIQTLHLPQDCTVLTAQWQPRNQTTGLTLWYDYDTEVTGMEPRQFIIFGTGHSIPDDLQLIYISTTQMADLVWHIFEVVP